MIAASARGCAAPFDSDAWTDYIAFRAAGSAAETGSGNIEAAPGGGCGGRIVR